MTWFTVLAVLLSIGFVILGRYSGIELSGSDHADDDYFDLTDLSDFFD